MTVAESGDDAELTLFGGFKLHVGGQKVALPMHACRVLAYLSLNGALDNDCDRRLLADRLWADSPTERSRASLRTALWLIRRTGAHLLRGDSECVGLARSVRVDVEEFRRRAEAVLADETISGGHCRLLDLPNTTELLPGWDEDWLVLRREQMRMLRLHALEHSARRMCDQGAHAQAVDVLLQVVDEEPLRESARAILIDAHLRAGNLAEARRQFRLFEAVLWREIKVRPSSEMCRLVSLGDLVDEKRYASR